jgi:hypothetical protein
MSDKIIHICGCDENGKHIKGLCCIIEDLQKENARLREENKNLKELKDELLKNKVISMPFDL